MEELQHDCQPHKLLENPEYVKIQYFIIQFTKVIVGPFIRIQYFLFLNKNPLI